MTGKPLLKSKTFWLNVVGMAAQVATVIPPPYGMIIMGVANIVNRLYTEQPITSVAK